jgi:hypothetical protein
MYPILEHPDITRALRTGYPDREHEDTQEEFDEDALYEEQREAAYDWE